MDVGDTVGSFTLTGKIGAGGMGAVYLALHKLIGRKAAVKVLLPELSSDPDITARFFNEAKAATAIQHPSIVGIFDFGHHESGCAYIVMEYLDGESLASRLKRLGKLPPDHAIAITRQVAGALGAAHGKGIVHRDLKPDNVMLVSDPEVMPFGERAKVLDFGIAKLISAGGGGHNKTRTGSVIGTPAYMSPEQCKGTGSIDQRADIYSLGCMLYEFMTGRTPFVSDGFGELIAAHIYSEPPPPSRIEPTINPGLDQLIMRMLAKNPDDRPPTMDAVQRSLDELGGANFIQGRGGSMMTPLPHGPDNKTMMEPGSYTPSPKPQSYYGGGTPLPGPAATAIGKKAGGDAGGTAILNPESLPDALARTPTTLSKALGEKGNDAVPAKKGKGALYAIVGAVVVAGGIAAFFATRGSDKDKKDGGGAVASGDPGKGSDPVKAGDPGKGSDPVKAGDPGKGSDPIKTDPVKGSDPVKTDPVKTDPATDPVKTDPVKTDPVAVKVTLTVESNPAGADVYRAADGVKLGKTPYPYSVTASPGEVEFLLKMSGYQDAKISLAADKDNTSKIELVKKKKGPGKPGDPDGLMKPAKPGNADDLMKPQ